MKSYLLLILIFLSSCTCLQEEDTLREKPVSDHALTMATLYHYYADEYKALAYQSFNIATLRVDEILAKHISGEGLAVVVDIDETLLDNSPNEALLIENDTSFPYMWKEWCDLARARAVPGAVEFLQYADARGLNVFYLSNRKKAYEEESTMKNLKDLGFPQVDDDHFLLKLERSDDNPNPSDKQSRRDEISARGYEIVMLVGDNLADFYTDEMQAPERTAQMESFREEYGRKFILLPNAMYGNWAASAGIRDAATMDSLLHNMTKVFN